LVEGEGLRRFFDDFHLVSIRKEKVAKVYLKKREKRFLRPSSERPA
jgi:hypothetical protein